MNISQAKLYNCATFVSCSITYLILNLEKAAVMTDCLEKLFGENNVICSKVKR